MKYRQRRQSLPAEPVTAEVTGISHEGRGVAHVGGETVFIDGALRGETVSFRYLKRRRGIAEAALVEVLTAAPERIEPRCPHFGVCGGCSLQHLGPSAQLALKQDLLRDQLERTGRLRPERWLPALGGSAWGYRRRARLGVKHVPAKGGVLVGFRERYSSYIAAIGGCEVLDPRVGRRLPELARLIERLSVVRQLPQVEVAIGDQAIALVFRNLAPLTADDQRELVDFGRTHEFQIYQQPGNEASIERLWPEQGGLSYRLDEHEVEIHFLPSDFTQVNAEVNRQMVAQALELLELSPQHQVLDLFCGLGNFTLPLARRAARVVGVEGEAGLVRRARDNAGHNGIGNCEFHLADLAADVGGLPWMRQRYDRILLDPPRSGAAALIPQIAGLGAGRIVYVSCNPATLARDAGLLVHQHGYRLRAVGAVDMFPQTAHVESMALFER